MAHQPQDGARDDGTMGRHKALTNPIMGRWGRLLRLIPSVCPNGLARHVLGRMVVFVGAFPLGSYLRRDHIRS